MSKNRNNFLAVINEGLFKVEKAVLTVTLLSMIILGLMQVFSRYVTHKPIPWSESLLTYMFIWSSFMGASYALGKNGHFQVDIVVKKLPGRLQTVINIIVQLILLIFCLYVLVIGTEMALMNRSQDMPVLPFSMMWPALALPVSAATMIIHILANLVQDVRECTRFGDGSCKNT